MMNKFFSFSLTIFFAFSLHAQEEITYQVNKKMDIPLIIGSQSILLTGFLLKNTTLPVTVNEIEFLDPSNINRFDRPATRQFFERDAMLSDYFLLGSAFAPFIPLASKKGWNEKFAILTMYFQVASITTGVVSISKRLSRRYRPYTYNPEVPLSFKTTQDASQSFFSGHVSNTAAFSFFTASMISSYTNCNWLKYPVWTMAVLTPAAVGYFRFSSGKHFPTDIITGYLVGGSIGLIIPYLHKYQHKKNESTRIDKQFFFTSNSMGFAILF